MDNCNRFIQQNARLSDFTTFRLGGPCLGVVTCPTQEFLKEMVVFLKAQNKKFVVIGQGSNLLFSDQGIDRYVLRFISQDLVVEHTQEAFHVSAATLLDHFIQYTVDKGFDGLVSLSGIPGTIGGAVVGNAGAFGKQISDCLCSLQVLTSEGKVKELTPGELDFTYRNSILKKTGDIVLSVKFSLKKGHSPDLSACRKEILSLRKERHPDYQEQPSAGSFFRNIESPDPKGKRQSAGLLLEKVQAKKMSFGGAKVFDKHANIIIRGQGCTAQDVYELSQRMAQEVKNTFNIDLVREVRLAGKFDNHERNAAGLFW